MRKLIVSNIVSLDGFYEGPGKNVMAMPMDSSFDDYCAERLRAAGTLLLGRNTYEAFKGFWPGVASDPKATPVHKEISRLDTALDKMVVSDSLKADETEPWEANTRIVRRANAHRQIAKLKRQTGGDILVLGSRILRNDLLANGLVDELHLMIGPVIVGGGTPVFDGQPKVTLRLIDMSSWAKSDNVLLRYAVGGARSSSKGKAA